MKSGGFLFHALYGLQLKRTERCNFCANGTQNDLRTFFTKRENFFFFLKGLFLDFFSTVFSHVSEDAGIESSPMTVATTAVTVRRTNHSARYHPL